MIYQWPTLLPILAVLVGVGVATLAGAINGLFIVGLGLVPFIVTRPGPTLLIVEPLIWLLPVKLALMTPLYNM